MTEPRTPTGRRTVEWDESPAMRERVLAIEAEAAALDVDRLTRASDVARIGFIYYKDEYDDGEWIAEDVALAAIAAEYERLAALEAEAPE